MKPEFSCATLGAAFDEFCCLLQQALQRKPKRQPCHFHLDCTSFLRGIFCCDP